MSDALIKDLRVSLTKLNRVVKKDISLDDDNYIELKDMMQEVIKLTGNIDSFVACLKIKKNPGMMEKMKRQQNIEEKMFKQFVPLMMAYNILLNNDEETK